MSIRIWPVFLCLIALMANGFAQTAPPAYRLGPEDVVTIVVLRHTELSNDFVVAPDGTIDYPIAGKIVAANKTVAELSADITEHLRDRLRTPEVTVTLHFARIQRIYVLGTVAKPGIYDLKPGWRITEALAAAGGILPEATTINGPITAPAPEDYTVTLLHAADGTQMTFPLPNVLAAKSDTNQLIQTGDVLTVMTIQLVPVYVMGVVKSPGMYEIRPDQGLREALALSGGLLLPQQDVKTTLLRGHENIAVDLNAQTPPPLQRGDVVTIEPLRAIHVMVTGQVQKPGIYDLKAGEGLLAAITQAGGVLDTASLTHVKIVHVAGPSEEVDITQALLAGGAEKPVTLNTGDLVVVPENTKDGDCAGVCQATRGHPTARWKKLGAHRRTRTRGWSCR